MSFIDTSKHVIILFLERVKATPHAPALEDRDHAYTYAELNDKVTALARRLRSRGIDQGKLVGILLPHTADFIIACLASLRAGGAYLILELAYPPDLLNAVIQDASPPLLMTYQSEVKNIKPGIPLIILDNDEEDIACDEDLCDISLPTEYDQDVMAFVSYSSGTTGLPKGIVNSDRPGILSYNQRFAISDQGPGHRIACNTFFIWEMFRPLIRGAMAFAVPDDISYDPVGLVELLADKHISETLMTPTLLASILSHFPDDDDDRLPDLRVLWITGEVVTTDLAQRALKALPNVRLLNSYSTSETWDTAIGEMKDVLHDAQQSTYCSVGTPLGVNEIYILDENGRRLEPGSSGEIFIGGPVLGLGYLNLPDVTARTFVPDPFSREPGARMYRSGDLGRILPSGALEIIGRIGSMIKLRGYSVVPATVQMAIVAHLAVRDCAVISYGDGLERQLIAYFVRDREASGIDRPVVAVDDCGFSPSARHTLSRVLAPYMIPAYWVEVARLPANPVSGKIDKKKLPPPPIAGRRAVVVEGVMANKSGEIDVEDVAQIWAWTLKIPRSIITSEHSFFDLGGHSLTLTALSKHFDTSFGFRIPVSQLANSPTLDGHLTKILAVKHGIDVSVEPNLRAMLEADCVLEEQIQPTNTEWCSLEMSDVIFLTGVTGFLGAYLLHDLLESTSATIMCLVRSNNIGDDFQQGPIARAKIRQGLLDKGLWSDTFMERIKVITGNLSSKYFGLSFEVFNKLATTTKVIIHAGATVNLVYSYAALRGTNVGGTREVLRLASLGGSTVHHISTNSVLAPSASAWSENSSLQINEAVEKIPDGYGQTKWVAEQLVAEAQNRGFPIKIYRVGTIGGHSVTGMANAQDLSTALIVESIELGYVPDVKGWRIEMTPVDFVSKSIVRLSNTEATQNLFHLGEPNPVTAIHLFDQLGQLGYSTKLIGWDAWLKLWAEKRASSETVASGPIHVLRSGMPSVDFLVDLAILGNSATEPYYKDLARPQIGRRLLEIYTRHWYARCWISKPPSVRHVPNNGSHHQVQVGPLSGRVAVITGASSGIGAATAVALAKEGVHVALAARRVEALESVKSNVQSYGVRVLVYQTDVTNREQVEALMRTATEVLGAIDILVACAGVMYYTLMKNAQQDQWDRTVDVNCKGVIHCLSSVVPDMISRGKGHILAISSDAGRKVFAGLGVYSGSKFFVEATLQSLRLETVGTGLRVTSIQPGNVATDLLALSTDQEAIKKYGEPSGAKVLDAEDVANAIVYALKQPEKVSVNEILIQPMDEPN